MYRRGLTVNMAGPQYFGPDAWTTIETDFNTEMLFTFAAGFNGARQVTLDYNWRDEFDTQLQNLTTAADWTKLRALIFGTQPSSGLQLSDLHYTGHGDVNQLGIGTPGFNIRLAILQLPLLKTNPMAYVAIDGCKVLAESTDMLTAFIGYTTNLTRLQCAGIGGIPAFAWGWKKAKPIGYLHQGLLFDKHWYFIDDYYDWLGRRDPNTGLLNHSYISAVVYAKDPNGMGFGGSSLMHNSEGDDFTSVGCSGCYLDEF